MYKLKRHMRYDGDVNTFELLTDLPQFTIQTVVTREMLVGLSQQDLKAGVARLLADEAAARAHELVEQAVKQLMESSPHVIYEYRGATA